jgi:IS30 family transposase
MGSSAVNSSSSLKKSLSLPEKLGSSAVASGRRYQQSHTRAQRDDFLAAVARLGTVAAAGRELGINRSTGQKWANAAGIRPYRLYTRGDRELFHAALLRAGNAGDAARELGVNVSTGRDWARRGIPVPKEPRASKPVTSAPKPPRPPAVKEEFLRVLREVGSVSVAARELGLKASTCFDWARAAGVASARARRPSSKQVNYFQLRRDGVSRSDAAAAVGASMQSSYVWDRQHTAHNTAAGGGAAADLPYTQEVRTTFAEPLAPDAAPSAPAALPQPAAPELALVALSALEQVLSPRYLSLAERERIADLYGRGESMRAIARALGRSPGSISREIKRNSHPTLGYRPYGAHRAATAARARPKTSKLAAHGPLRDYVEDKLRIRWSPEQISKLLIKEFPHDGQMRVSHETIYQSLYFQARGGLRREIKEALRTGRTRRKKHKNPEERTSRFRDPMINISERPAEVEDRAVPGHWEGDLITGTNNQSAIATLVERNTRYVMLVHLPLDHGAEAVRDGLIKTMLTLPAHLRGSLTWDQGVEMAKHKAFSIATDMDVYFCDPHSPWQRGTNENTNGLLRQYFPKGTDLGAYGPEDLEHVAQELNARPRKTLDWNTPAERLRDLLKPA